MRTRTKHLLIPACCTAALAVYLMLLAALLAPRIVRVDAVEARIKTAVRQACDCTFEFGSLEFSALPWPEFTLQRVSLRIPKKIRARLQRVSIHPSLADLFLGRLQIDRIDLVRPRITLYPGRHEPPPFLDPDFLQRKMLSGALDTEVAISKGTVTLIPPSKKRYTARDLSLQLSLSRFPSIRMSCTSSLWRHFSLEAGGSARNMEYTGTLRLERLTSDDLLKHVPLPEPWELTETCLNLEADFRLSQLRYFQADLRGSLPQCRVCRNDRSSDLRASSFEASLRREKGYTRIVLDRLDLASPGAAMQAEILLTEDPPSTDLKLTCSELDLSSFRACTGTLLADNPVLEHIFRVLREGRIPSLTIASHGATPAQFADNLLVRATIDDSHIFVPDLETEFSRVSAEVLLANGILRATKLQGRLQDLRAREGSLRFGIGEQSDTPFSLQLSFEGGLQPVPDILRKTLQDQEARQRLRLLNGLRGSASGTFMLTESLQGLKPDARIRTFDLRADYAPLPGIVAAEGENLVVSPDEVRLGNARFTLGESSVRGVSATLDLHHRAGLHIKADTAEIRLQPIFSWLRDSLGISRLASLRGRMTVEGLSLDGPPADPQAWNVACRGALHGVGLRLDSLPDRIRVPSGSFRVREGRIWFDGVETRVQDASLSLSGSLRDYRSPEPEVQAAFRGLLRARAVRRGFEALGVPHSWLLRTPLRVRRGNLHWKDGRVDGFNASLRAHGSSVSLRLGGSWSPGELRLKDCTIGDGNGKKASFSARLTQETASLDFRGELDATTLDSLLAADNPYLRGSVGGDFRAQFNLAPLYLTGVKGGLQLREARIPAPGPKEAVITRLDMQAKEKELAFPSFTINWRDHRICGRGSVSLEESGNVFNVRIVTEHLKWSGIRQALDEAARREGGGPEVRLSGTLNVITRAFFYRDLVFAPFKANIRINPDRTARIRIREAGLCAVPVQGTMDIAPDALSIAMSVHAGDQSFKPFLACLRGGKRVMSGRFDLRGEVSAQAEDPDQLVKSLDGSISLQARDGRIYRFSLLAKIMALLNSTEIFFGQAPQLEKEGLGYHAVRVEGEIDEGVLKLDRMLIDGHSMEIAFRGDIKLSDGTVDLIVLVAPLKTMDRLVKRIPLVSTIMGGNLISIPFRVTGEAADPTVVPLSPKAVGSELLGYMKRTLKLPFTLFQPLFPEGSPELVPRSGGNGTDGEQTQPGGTYSPR